MQPSALASARCSETGPAALRRSASDDAREGRSWMPAHEDSAAPRRPAAEQQQTSAVSGMDTYIEYTVRLDTTELCKMQGTGWNFPPFLS
eukprot:COSAG01_NODE_581_length_15195_cov_16.315291_4_plen_90_part_00